MQHGQQFGYCLLGRACLRLQLLVLLLLGTMLAGHVQETVGGTACERGLVAASPMRAPLLAGSTECPAATTDRAQSIRYVVYSPLLVRQTPDELFLCNKVSVRYRPTHPEECNDNHMQQRTNRLHDHGWTVEHMQAS